MEAQLEVGWKGMILGCDHFQRRPERLAVTMPDLSNDLQEVTEWARKESADMTRS